LRDESAGSLTGGDFRNSLMQGQILEKMLSPRERQSLMEFFRDGMLDRIESQPGFVYDPDARKANMWIYRFNSLGIVAPVISQIWEAWWELDHPGKAVCKVMYASGFFCVRAENPVYRTDTGTDCRGPFSPRPTVPSSTGRGGTTTSPSCGKLYQSAISPENSTWPLKHARTAPRWKWRGV
jgi:hypothetical protein